MLIQRFDRLSTSVARIYKDIQRIKKQRMHTLGLKSTHVMCLYQLNYHPSGLTAADLCRLCKEDKAGISRILADLEARDFICYESGDGKKYRAKAVLTEAGKDTAAKVDRMILDAVEKAGNGISQKEREIFYRVLLQVAENLDLLCKEFCAP